MLISYFSNDICIYYYVGKLPEQHFSVWLFSNPGGKILVLSYASCLTRDNLSCIQDTEHTRFWQNKSHFNLNSSLLMLNFSISLSVQFTLNTFYLTQKQKDMLQKRMDPNCIIIDFSFHNFKNRFFQIESDFNLKSSFSALYFGHKGQFRVLAVFECFTRKNCLKYVLMKKN